ncbi:MAG: SRPBCC family protein [Gammaproteobacteria bacterium]|nr:SRPBCC family protein [Gammaproteobacteria bacterium]
MKPIVQATLLAFLLAGEQASAEVVDAAAGGFTTVNEVHIDVARADAWRIATSGIDQWWSSDHTVSGDAGRLYIEALPQGCFCERLGDGAGVVHLTVTMVSPGVVLRMTGGLGPLGLMGVNGNMTWEFDDDGDGSRVRFTYAVGGYSANGLDTIAPAVDHVIGEALLRLKALIETGDAENVDRE